MPADCNEEKNFLWFVVSFHTGIKNCHLNMPVFGAFLFFFYCRAEAAQWKNRFDWHDSEWR